MPRGYIPWSTQEEERLRQLFPQTDTKSLTQLFGRTYGAIFRRAERLGIKADYAARWLERPIGNSLTETERAYIAGLFDGEGYIGLLKPNKQHRLYSLAVEIVNSDCSLLLWIKAHYGGSVGHKGKSGVWEWRMQYAGAARFLIHIAPFLRLKAERAKLAIEFQSSKKLGGRRYRLAVTEQDLLNEERFYWAIRSRNGGPVRQERNRVEALNA